MLAIATLNTNAQSVGMIGSFPGSNWSTDIVMNTTDNTNYSLTAFTLLSGAELKFRQDGAWATNWGASVQGTVANPTPLTGVLTSDKNLYIIAGTYDIAFNRVTGAYSFTVVSLGYDEIGFNGGFNSWGANEMLTTANGIDYVKGDFYFNAAGVKFNRVSPATTWGGTAFPSGTATVSGATIPLTAGYYNVDFNKTSLLYNFVVVPVTLIGDGVDGGNFSTDYPMVSTDGGVTFTMSNVPLVNGSVKFRTNASWALNWGAGTETTVGNVRTGTAVVNGSNNIATTTGNYDISFNRQTLQYTFTYLGGGYTVIDFSNNAVASAMVTSDGVNYSKADIYCPVANSKFVDNATPTTFWGGTMFPNGTATLSGADIPSTIGNFNVSFNKNTLAYSYSVTPLGIIGDATAGGWGSDQDMTSTDGITYTASGIVLTAGQVKFRSNDAWALAWGTADANPNVTTAFPSGTAISSGTVNNIDVVPGTYNVTFNRVTGAYSFVDPLSNNQFEKSNFGLYPNPATSSFTINADVAKVAVYSMTGQLVKQFNGTFDSNYNYSISDLNNGIYLVRIMDNDNNEKSLRLIKQ